MFSRWRFTVFGEMNSLAPIFFVAEPARQVTEDLDLAIGQLVGPGAAHAGAAMAGGGEHRFDRVATQRPIFDEQLGRLVTRARGPIRARLGHRVIRVGRGDDARGAIERAAVDTAVIAFAVEPLVMAAGDRGVFANSGVCDRIRSV